MKLNNETLILLQRTLKKYQFPQLAKFVSASKIAWQNVQDISFCSNLFFVN